MRIALGADHAGFPLKETIKKELERAGHEIEDWGTSSEASVDYPDYARQVAERVARQEVDRGILVCGTGIGMAITANKVPGVRAANVSDEFNARLSRQHNDANVLTLGAGLVGPALARQITQAWLETDFGGSRHARRVEKIMAIERRFLKAGSPDGPA